MLASGASSSICTASALRLEQAALPKPRFREERGIVLPVAVEVWVAVESSELMDNPEVKSAYFGI